MSKSNDELVKINWFDVTKITNDDSFEEKLFIDHRLSKMETIGWLHKESKKAILLVQEFDDEKPRDYVVIPKVLILKRETIQKQEVDK